jgi:hypothetical protein
LESWYEKDPNYFRQIKNKNGRTVGFFIILFIKQKYLTDFALGRMFERDIDASKILTPSEIKNFEETPLYISVVVGKNERAITNTCIILCVARYLDKMREIRKISKLYATAATSNGRELMKDHLGFTLCISGSQRKDGEDFFEADIYDKPFLFDYLVEKSSPFQRCSLSISNLNSEDDWKPSYIQRKV